MRCFRGDCHIRRCERRPQEAQLRHLHRAHLRGSHDGSHAAVSKSFGIPDVVAGAWLGGTLDTSGSVVAAGALISETAMKVGVIVKMSQNVLIGVAAFILSVVWTFKKAAEVPGGQKPSLMEIWYRFPKFVLGFIIASVVFSFFLDPSLVNAVKGPLARSGPCGSLWPSPASALRRDLRIWQGWAAAGRLWRLSLLRASTLSGR